MSEKTPLALLPLMVGSQTLRPRSKAIEGSSRAISYVFATAFCGLALWHLSTPGARGWVIAYLAAAILSLIPSRGLLLLWCTGMAATACGSAFLVVAGIADQEAGTKLLSPDSLGMLCASLWFAYLFLRDLRGTRDHDRIAEGYQFINLRNLQR